MEEIVLTDLSMWKSDSECDQVEMPIFKLTYI